MLLINILHCIFSIYSNSLTYLCRHLTTVATVWLMILNVDLLQSCQCSFSHTQGQYPLQGAGLYAICVHTLYGFFFFLKGMKMTKGDP